jgi:hypothetical protein
MCLHKAELVLKEVMPAVRIFSHKRVVLRIDFGFDVLRADTVTAGRGAGRNITCRSFRLILSAARWTTGASSGYDAGTTIRQRIVPSNSGQGPLMQTLDPALSENLRRIETCTRTPGCPGMSCCCWSAPSNP